MFGGASCCYVLRLCIEKLKRADSRLPDTPHLEYVTRTLEDCTMEEKRFVVVDGNALCYLRQVDRSAAVTERTISPLIHGAAERDTVVERVVPRKVSVKEEQRI